LEACAKSLGFNNDEIAFVGDDYVDLPCLKRVGLAVCPPESPDILKDVCHYETKTSAGQGVVREVIEILIQAQGAWKKVMAQFAVFMVCVLLAFSGCSKKVSQQDFAEKPDQWIEHFTITETLGGMPVWILNSEIAQVYEKKKKVTLDDIKIQFMNTGPVKKKQTQRSLMLAKKNQTQTARLKAPKGEVNLDTRDLLAWGGVEVESQDGIKLYTERLMFSSSRQKILSDSPVKIVRQDSILLGEGLEATPDLETVKILRHQASIYPKTLQLKQ
jgi:LPS export ABC transporter protein LptC